MDMIAYIFNINITEFGSSIFSLFSSSIMIPIFKEEIKPNQALLHPNSLINLQFSSNIPHTSNPYNVLCISSSDFSQKLYLFFVFYDELKDDVIALPKWLSLTLNEELEHLKDINIQPISISGK